VSGSVAGHYDRVTAAWTLLLGDELHYGLFRDAQNLQLATRSLTEAMTKAARIGPGDHVLDVGCGVGAPACYLAREIGARVTGISTSREGLRLAAQRASREGVGERISFERRDGMDNGFPDASFDRVLVLESSHLMRRRDRLISECSRVLVPGGRIALCDIVLRRRLPFSEVRRLRRSLALLREVFGDARMEPVSEYRRLYEENGLAVDLELDLTAATRQTFRCWIENAETHAAEVADLVGAAAHQRFVEACTVMEDFWDDGTLGYALLAASKAQ